MWCITEHDISRYNTSTLEMSNTLSFSNILHIKAVTLTDSRDLIAACGENYGLHRIKTKNGVYNSNCLIENASFRDVCFLHGKIYALSDNEGKQVTILVQQSTWSWLVSKIVKFQLRIASIYAVSGHIHVAFMDDKKQVGVYDVEMIMVNSVAFVRGWHLVDVDEAGGIIAYPGKPVFSVL